LPYLEPLKSAHFANLNGDTKNISRAQLHSSEKVQQANYFAQLQGKVSKRCLQFRLPLTEHKIGKVSDLVIDSSGTVSGAIIGVCGQALWPRPQAR
jgi:hypothetical protein